MPKEYKLVILGTGGVGKSAIAIRYVQSVFTENYDPTIEDSYRKTVRLASPSFANPSQQQHVQVEIIDTAGTDQFEAMRELYMKTGDGFMVVYSVTSRASMREAEEIAHQIRRVPLVLVGNKTDVAVGREVSKQEGALLARTWSCPHWETSARTGANVDEAFGDLTLQVVSHQDLSATAKDASVSRAKTARCCCMQ